jgi:hypothetical protein
LGRAGYAVEFEVHPVVHVVYQLIDRVGEGFDLTGGLIGAEVFDAGYGVGVGAFAVEEFYECGFEQLVSSLREVSGFADVLL